MTGLRARRVAEAIAAVVAEVLRRDMSDPRLAAVTIKGARVSPDLRLATVLYSVYPGGEPEIEAAAAALEGARGRFRHAVGQQVRLRVTPQIRFVIDRSGAYAAHIEEVIADLGAAPAGDAATEPRDPDDGA